MDWDDARHAALVSVVPLGTESVALSDAVGRVLARDLVAAQDIPHYASSAMDGWAASGEGPWTVTGSPDRDGQGSGLRSGAAMPIVTGGLIPPGTDRILRAEHATEIDAALELAEGARTPIVGADIRPPAQEAHAGDTLVTSRTVINPAHLAVAASCALDAIEVTIRPRVALLLTGDEVIEHGVPVAGQVRDSFGPLLPALVGMLGGAVVFRRRVADRREATVSALVEASRGNDLIITTGGTGTSRADHLRAALAELDAELVVRRLSVRPGGPSFLARLPDGTMVVGLAGNPLAAISGLLILAEPLLRAWSGRPLGIPTTVTTAREIAGNDRMTQLLPYGLLEGHASPSAWTGSGMMRGLAESKGLLVVPPDGLGQGARAEALALPWPTE